MTAAAAIGVGLRSRSMILMATFVGLVAFLWPFVVVPGRFGDATMAPLLFGALLILVLAIVFSELARGGIDAKAIAMLGVLSAIGAALRPLGAGTAGIELVFFTLVIAGRVFGPGFGFTLGCTTLFASALITGGVGPWMPYQMFGCAWVGLFAGLLPPATGRREVLMLATYGALAAYLYGLMINLSFWPFALDPHSGIAYLPGASTAVNLHRYVIFDATTSLGWDTGRAITNFVCILLVGSAMLATFRRASRRAAFGAPIRFDPHALNGTQAGSADAGDVPAGAHRAEMDQHLAIRPPGALLGIGDAALGTERPDQLPRPPEVGPGHGREEMVLDLGVESAEHESGEGATGQVPRGEHLAAEESQLVLAGQDGHAHVVGDEARPQVEAEQGLRDQDEDDGAERRQDEERRHEEDGGVHRQ
jgi:energy-coupling factor transport system substrate-specific component